MTKAGGGSGGGGGGGGGGGRGVWPFKHNNTGYILVLLTWGFTQGTCETGGTKTHGRTPI